MTLNATKTDVLNYEQLQTKAVNIFQHIGSKIKMSTDSKTQHRIQQFINDNYKTHFPKIAQEQPSDYHQHSFVFYHEDNEGNVIGTASLLFDNVQGFNQEQTFKQQIQHYRREGARCLQIGRLIISHDNNSNDEVTLKDYFRLFYLFSKRMGFDVVVGLIKQKDIAFHQKLLGAKLLNPDTRIDFGGKHIFAVAAWELDLLKPRFFNWASCRPEPKNLQIYQPNQWQDYARSFASVQTSFQRELQLSVCELLYGEVADFGCGSAKLAPFLTDNAKVTGYLGIDCSAEMIKIANWLIAQFECPEFSTFQGKIEDYHGKRFDSAVSLNSYYSWPEPIKVLRHIHSLLNTNGTFVLATPNLQIDMLAMEKVVRKELLTHPDFSTFSKINLELVSNTEANFITMDQLIHQLHSCGFTINSCHQSFYLGGLNFIVAEKAN